MSATAKKAASGIAVSWKASPVAIEYAVYRRVNGTSSWTLIAYTADLSFTDYGAKKGTYYQYSVRAIEGDSMSAHLATKKVRW